MEKYASFEKMCRKVLSFRHASSLLTQMRSEERYKGMYEVILMCLRMLICTYAFVDVL